MTVGDKDQRINRHLKIHGHTLPPSGQYSMLPGEWTDIRKTTSWQYLIGQEASGGGYKWV